MKPSTMYPSTVAVPSSSTVQRRIQPSKKTPTQQFAERVTIAGLDEAFNSKWRIDRALFRLSLILCFVMIVYQAFAIGRQYVDLANRRVFLDTEQSNTLAPFPRVTVCFAPSVNDDLLWSMADIPAPVRAAMREKNISKNDISSHIRDAFSMHADLKASGTLTHIFTKKLYAAVVESAEAKNRTVSELLANCSSILSNCAFDGYPFDCCATAEVLTILSETCFSFQLNAIQIPNTTSPETAVQSSGLTFDVSTDWTYGVFENGTASDGYHVFIDVLPSQVQDPISIPAGMDAVIILAQPIEVAEISRCFRPGETPPLSLFTSYDSHGAQCQAEMLSKMIQEHVGCSPPMLSYMHVQTCSIDQAYLLMLLISGTEIEDFSFATGNRVNEMMRDAVATLKYISNDSPCLPLCTRCTYRVLSASYGSIRYADQSRHAIEFSNRSWSRIRVALPDRSPRSHEEQRIAVGYLAMCEIGGMMGVYAGFSMVTFVQIAAHGLWLCVEMRRRRRRRVGRLERVAPEEGK